MKRREGRCFSIFELVHRLGQSAGMALLYAGCIVSEDTDITVLDGPWLDTAVCRQ